MVWRGPIRTHFQASFKRSLSRRGLPSWLFAGLALALGSAAIWLGLVLSASVSAPSWVTVWGSSAGGVPLVLRLERGAVAKTAAWDDEPVTAQLRGADGFVLSTSVIFDEDESAVVSFAHTMVQPTRLRVGSAERALVDGPLPATGAAFGRQLTVHPATVKGRDSGPLNIDVSVVEGRLQLGREGTLELRVAAPGAMPLSIETQGLELVSPKTLRALVTDQSGQLRLRVLPNDLSASLRVVAAEEPPSEFFAEIPIERTQFWAENRDGTPVIRSLLPVAYLHYALVTEQGLVARGRVAAKDAVSLEFLKLPATPSWLIVGREPALDGPSAVGWPMQSVRTDTITWRESLLLDGKPAALREHHRAVTVRAKTVLFGLLTVAVLFLLTVASYWRMLQRPVPKFEDTTGQLVSVPVVSSRLALVFVFLLALGFAALGLWASVRLWGE